VPADEPPAPPAPAAPSPAPGGHGPGPARRLVALRCLALLGLAASAALVGDSLRPERAWCPLASACEAARESALGSFLGIPTSWIGLLAFAGLLALTLVPFARAALATKVVGIAAAVAGSTLLAFQAFALGTFCPFCVVADLSAVAAGGVVLLGGPPPTASAGEPRRLWWAAPALVAVALPLAWPRGGGQPGWVAIPAPGTPSPAPAAPGTPPPPVDTRVPVVEYLNPFCPHCRATHVRLAAVLAETQVKVRRERIYVWTNPSPPLWAKACVCAQDLGDERLLFRELLQARSESPAEIWEAARRAGFDVEKLRACVERGDADARLANLHRLVLDARIQGLPTLDIGRRRLQGEQSEAELREALAAATP
jgi:uncharacterized membrane protein/protein-disulfide isomerase